MSYIQDAILESHNLVDAEEAEKKNRKKAASARRAKKEQEPKKIEECDALQESAWDKVARALSIKESADDAKPKRSRKTFTKDEAEKYVKNLKESKLKESAWDKVARALSIEEDFDAPEKAKLRPNTMRKLPDRRRPNTMRKMNRDEEIKESRSVRSKSRSAWDKVSRHLGESARPVKRRTENSINTPEYNANEARRKRESFYRHYANLDESYKINEDNINDWAFRRTCNYWNVPPKKLKAELLKQPYTGLERYDED